MPARHSRRTFLAAAVAVPVAAAAVIGARGVAHADECFTWDRDLEEGMDGPDVTELQIRLAGYPEPGQVLPIDGAFGASTTAALTLFQQAYGLTADGKATSETFEHIYSLQDADCTPIHFTYEELNSCNSDFSGGKVDAATAKANALVAMWKLEAMRHAMGDAELVVSSGFRSVSCNDAVGGAPDSRHLYGDGVDLTGSHSFCDLAKQAQNHGFNGILGPGFPGHDDHVHLDGRPDQYWDAPDCGVGS
ncbi:MAG: D-Ala-D-Ala carboxypeptidase family metallohydrolase [Stackebrandtia sp.]